MIGVVASSSKQAIIREFFELFKTPWEFYRRGRRYDVLLCAGSSDFDQSSTSVIIIYAGEILPFDVENGIEVGRQRKDGVVLTYRGKRIPLYGDSVIFRQRGAALVDGDSDQPATAFRRVGQTAIIRVGYDLFSEAEFLLTSGQPPANAGIPTLDLHIALLRDLIIGAGVPLVEVPPIPDGYRFIACLTHDVDHPSIRKHTFDHTMYGFLYRATAGSLLDVLRGRVPLRSLLRNWSAVLKLPFVYLGLARDFWSVSDDYAKLEMGLPSSFFVIPFKNYPGRTTQGLAPNYRASRYGAVDIADTLRTLLSSAKEVGVHGIDAWLDSSSGQKELEEIRQVTGDQEIGTRMHWLYFSEQSPVNLEEAGFDYDSTVGYNGTVGYRAGTTQVYKPLSVARLLELPLHIMDTALFFPGHLDLSSTEARKRVDSIIDNAIQLGGTITVNWHDRSMAPERLWGDFYLDLVEELKNRGALFSTASQAVSWFRKRRAVVFEKASWESDELRVTTSMDADDDLPGLRLRIYNAPEPHQMKTHIRDLCLEQSMDVCLAPTWPAKP